MVFPLKYTRSRHLSTFRPFIMFAWTKIEKEAKTGGVEEKRIKTKKEMQPGSQKKRVSRSTAPGVLSEPLNSDSKSRRLLEETRLKRLSEFAIVYWFGYFTCCF